MGGYVRAMRQYAVFQGRASRSEFWTYTAIVLGLGFVALIIDTATGQGTEKSPGGILTVLVVLAHFIPTYAVTARRLHDTDRSGWMILLLLIPFIGLILIVFVLMRGTPGPNGYGPDPLDPMAVAAATATGTGAGVMPAIAVPPPAAPMRSDLIAELERLGRLRKDGHLNDAEFEVMKAEALAQGRR